MAKDTPRTTAGELQKKLSLGVRKPLKNCQTAPTSPHVVWERFKRNYPSSSKNKLQHIQLSDTTGTSNGLASIVDEKIIFLAANTQDGFGEHMDKSTQCVK